MGKQGFSLVEALIVLAVAGLALMLAFSAAERGAVTGFRIGRHALEASDNALSRADLAAVLSSFTPALKDQPVAASALVGGADDLQGPALLRRATACGEEGPVQLLRLAVRRDAHASTIFCQADSRAAVALITLPAPDARLSYAEQDGGWLQRLTPQDRPASATSVTPTSSRILIRLSSDQLKMDVTGAADSGPPFEHPNPVVQPSALGPL